MSPYSFSKLEWVSLFIDTPAAPKKDWGNPSEFVCPSKPAPKTRVSTCCNRLCAPLMGSWPLTLDTLSIIMNNYHKHFPPSLVYLIIYFPVGVHCPLLPYSPSINGWCNIGVVCYKCFSSLQPPDSQYHPGKPCLYL